jgi:hypothetical protein
VTLWDDLAEQRPDIADAVGLLTEAVLDRRREQPWLELLVERGMDRRSAEAAAEPATVPSGILGAGAWVVHDGLAPALFVLPALAPVGLRGDRPARLPETEARYLITGGAGRELRDVVVVPLLPPTELTGPAAPGDGLTVGARHGTIGTPAELAGAPGVLTAGHVAPTIGLLARDTSGDVLGRVELTLSRGAAPPDATTADVAFVSTSRPVTPPAGGLRTARALRARDRVGVWGREGRRRTWVRGLSPEFLVDPDGAAWGQVALTGEPVARNGDSGAMVVAADGALVGHVVGGTPDGYSVVQDLQYQLSELSTDLRI